MLQRSRDTFAFFELNHLAHLTEYCDIPYSRPVFFPSMKISREKNGIYSVDESMRAGDERKFEKNHFPIHLFLFATYSHPLNKCHSISPYFQRGEEHRPAIRYFTVFCDFNLMV